MIAPPQGRPKGTVHFLGGAFAGASPQLIYPLLLQLLARAGYTVISTPYAVTFKHVVCAGAVHKVSPPIRRPSGHPPSTNPLLCFLGLHVHSPLHS